MATYARHGAARKNRRARGVNAHRGAVARAASSWRAAFATRAHLAAPRALDRAPPLAALAGCARRLSVRGSVARHRAARIIVTYQCRKQHRHLVYRSGSSVVYHQRSGESA